METLVILGLIIGLISGIAISSFFNNQRKKQRINQQSVILLDKIKQVCKLITVEGEFSEIFTHHDEKNLFFNLLQMKKKALIIIKAKVMIGFDLTRINIEVISETKQVKLTQFPESEILSMETDLEYYDIQKGIINKFSETDLTDMTKKSKDFIREKVAGSQLILMAQNQASETLLLIKQLIESVGWELVSEKTLAPAKDQARLKE